MTSAAFDEDALSAALIEEMVSGGVVAVLASQRVVATPEGATEAPGHGRWIAASSTFRGDAAEGALTVVASRAVWLRYAAFVNPEGICDALLADMAGELTNMVLGKVRNALAKVGIDVHQSVPTCAFGEDITFRDPAGAASRWLRFATAGGDLLCRLDAIVHPSFHADPELGASEILEEGFLMF
jgi:Chemotaxis phosphatase CheX